MPVLPTQYRVVGIAIVVVAMAFGVQRWGSIFQPREGSNSHRQSTCRTTSQDACKASDKQSQRRNRRLRAGMSFRDLRDAWSPRNNRDQSPAVNDPRSNVAIDFILSPELQRAISQSRYPIQVMPDVADQPDLLMDLDFLTLDDDHSDHAPPQYSPHGYYSPRHSPTRDAFCEKSRSPSSVMMITSPSSSRSNSYTRAVREWERVHQEQCLAKQNVSVPAPLNVRKNSADSLYDDAGFWISPTPTPAYEPNAFPFRDSIHVGNDYYHSDPTLAASKRRPARQSQGQELSRVKRVRLHEPLPDVSSLTREANNDVRHRHKADSGVGSDFGEDEPSRRHLHCSSVYSFDAVMEIERENKFAPIDAELSSDPTHETIVHETVAPAAVHETIIEDPHEIKHEVTTREIHNHDVYHRVLPIIDVEVLPSRHFIRDGNDPNVLHEIPPSALPALREKVHQAMTEASSHILPAPLPASEISHPRRFTARDFPGTEGDSKEYTTPDGILHTERSWVHPPTLDETAHEAGKTEAFHFDHPDGRPDGFRADHSIGQDGAVTTAIPPSKPVLKRYVSGSTETAAAAAAAAALRIHTPGDAPAGTLTKKPLPPSPPTSSSRSLQSSTSRLKALPARILEKFH